MDLNPEKKFRTAITPAAVFIAAAAWAFFTVLILVDEGFAFNKVAYLIVVPAVLCFSWLWACLLHLFFPAKLTLQGLHGHSVWGIRRFIEWDDVDTVRKFRTFNLEFARVYSRSTGRVIWLPLFLADPSGFLAAMNSVCPSDNPLLKHVVKRVVLVENLAVEDSNRSD